MKFSGSITVQGFFVVSTAGDFGVDFVALALMTDGEGVLFFALTLFIECEVTFTPSFIGVRGVLVFSFTVFSGVF